MKRHALIVGINHYADPALNDLKGAERDAADLYGIVRDRLHFDAAEYLPAPSSDELIARLDTLIAGLKPGDQFLFFFAGHGVLDVAQGDQLLLMPTVRYTHVRHRMNTVSVGLLRDETAGRGLQRVFILDCCRSNLEANTRDGTRTLFRGATVLRDLGVRARKRSDLPPESLSILCSCDDGHQAAEIPGGQGLFTAALAQRLRAPLPLITLDGEFVDAVRHDMRELAQRHQLDHDQQPLWLPDGAAPVLWHKPDDGTDQAALRDAARWAVAERSATIAAYQVYLDDCEHCDRRAEAEAVIARLGVEAARQESDAEAQRAKEAKEREQEEARKAEAERREREVREAEIRKQAEAEASRKAEVEAKAREAKEAEARRKAEAEATRPKPTPVPRSPMRLIGIAALVVMAAVLLWPKPEREPVPPVGAASAAKGVGGTQKPIAAEAAPTQGRSRQGYEPEMVEIPAGRYTIGSPSGEEGRQDDEGPQHELRVGAFGLMKHEVSVEEYAAFLNAAKPGEAKRKEWVDTREEDVTANHLEKVGGMYRAQAGYERHPVSNVSWHGAVAYAEWLSKETGKRYRLPTEAEWEYAARAGTEGPFNFGGISAAKANYNARYQYAGSPKGEYRGDTTAAGTFAGSANAWGVEDMHGNVLEWTCSAYDGEGYKQGKDGAHTQCGDIAPDGRALRGGSWYYEPWGLRSAYRGRGTAGLRYILVGFRLAQDP